jgi:glycosyltransferase involved in cell wall biosynthesis
LVKPELHIRLNRLLSGLKPDVINIHNIHAAAKNGWSLDLISICEKFAPIIWTMHDMWAFTGRCIYNNDCQKYLGGCDASCPTPDDYPSVHPKKIQGEWQQKRQLIEGSTHLAGVTPSRWLADKARGGMWKTKRVEVIPYGLPLNVFSPVEKSVARKALGLETEGLVLLLAAHQLEDQRKGVQFALQAIETVPIRPLSLLTMGSGNLQINFPGVKVFHMGYIDHERTRALIYNAADLFLHPSLADNLPNTVLEAISCGTPVLAFAVGGLPEEIEIGVTGWLVSGISSNALSDGLGEALTYISQGNSLTNLCRMTAVSKYSMELQAKRYLDLFISLR